MKRGRLAVSLSSFREEGSPRRLPLLLLLLQLLLLARRLLLAMARQFSDEQNVRIEADDEERRDARRSHLSEVVMSVAGGVAGSVTGEASGSVPVAVLGGLAGAAVGGAIGGSIMHSEPTYHDIDPGGSEPDYTPRRRRSLEEMRQERRWRRNFSFSKHPASRALPPVPQHQHHSQQPQDLSHHQHEVCNPPKHL